jgi:hypothetical protein
MEVLVLIKRATHETDEVLAIFDKKTFDAEKLLKFFRNPLSEVRHYERFEPLNDDRLQELFSEWFVYTWFGSYIINVMEVL